MILKDLDQRGNSPLRPPSNKRLERTRHERASLLSCVGEPLKRNVRLLLGMKKHAIRIVVALLTFSIGTLIAALLPGSHRSPDKNSVEPQEAPRVTAKATTQNNLQLRDWIGK